MIAMIAKNRLDCSHALMIDGFTLRGIDLRFHLVSTGVVTCVSLAIKESHLAHLCLLWKLQALVP